MKKLGLILLTAAVMVACGNKAKEAEQARLDSIARADSIAKVEAMMADSIAAIQQAEAAAEQARLDSIVKADSIAAIKSGKPAPKRAIAKPVDKPSTPAIDDTRSKYSKNNTFEQSISSQLKEEKKEEPKTPQTPAEAAAAVERAKKEAIQKAQTPAEAAAAAERAKKEAVSK